MVAVAAGRSHSLILRSDGRVFALDPPVREVVGPIRAERDGLAAVVRCKRARDRQRSRPFDWSQQLVKLAHAVGQRIGDLRIGQQATVIAHVHKTNKRLTRQRRSMVTISGCSASTFDS